MNKYHYAFSYFLKPIEIKQYQSTVLKKAYDTKKDAKAEAPVKARKVKVKRELSLLMLFTKLIT